MTFSKTSVVQLGSWLGEKYIFIFKRLIFGFTFELSEKVKFSRWLTGAKFHLMVGERPQISSG